MARLALPPSSRLGTCRSYPRVVLLALLWSFASSALAQVAVTPDLGPFSINDDDPLSSVPSLEAANKNPLQMGYLVMELADRADAATARGDNAKAGLYFLALAKAAPDLSVGFKKACESFEAAGQWKKAADSCRAALGRKGVDRTDFLKYVGLMLKKQGPLDAKEIDDVDAVIAQIEQNVGEPGRRMVTHLKCRLAVRTEDGKRLEACAEAVRTWHPKDKDKFVFSSLFALKKGDWDEAREIIESGEKAGIPADMIARAKQTLMAREEAVTGKQPSRMWWPGVVAAMGLVLLLGAAVLRKRLNPKPA